MKQKISLVYKNSEGEISEELIWAELLNSGYYRVDNIPFYAPNIAYNDIISVEKDNNKFYFEDLIETSGNSTVQIVFFDKSKEPEIIQNLEMLGCSWEGMEGGGYYAIDVPANVDYSKVRNFFIQSSEILDYKEACLSEKHHLEIS